MESDHSKFFKNSNEDASYELDEIKPKYLICFRGADHPHDALKDGIKPHGGETGPIIYEGAINPISAIPISPRLEVAASFPMEEHKSKEYKKTTIDVVLIPVPQKEDELFINKIAALNNAKGQVEMPSTFGKGESDSQLVNTSSLQKLESITSLRIAVNENASKEKNLRTLKKLEETTYDDLSGMVWSHELAVKDIPRQNVVATMTCEKKNGKFKISNLKWQDPDIVNPDFITLGFKEKLENYLQSYLNQEGLIPIEESVAYKGFFANKKDYQEFHSNPYYQIACEEIQAFCDENKIDFTHENNNLLMDKFKKQEQFNKEQLKQFIQEFCEKLRLEHEKKKQAPTF